ncbi:MAG: AEC family transporter [Firmicutes bacterium]|nr:AEC family transporter [Bacillota bacterium]
MFNSFLFSLNSVLPIFIVIAFGYFLKSKNYLDDDTVTKINKISFKFCISTLLFNDVYTADMKSVFDVRLVMYAFISTLVIFFVLWGISALFIKEKKALGAFVQGCFRGNYAVIGIPLITSILGQGAASKAASVTIFVIPLYNILAVIILTVTSQEKTNNKGSAVTVAKNIAKNPLIIGILLGFILSFFEIRLPEFAESSIGYIAKLAAPLALIAIGGRIDMKKMKDSFLLAATACFVKLVLIPCVFLMIAYYALGITQSDNMIVLYVLYACPSAINSAIMAEAMGSDGKLAANIVLLTTLLSVFTFTAGVTLFRMLGIV